MGEDLLQIWIECHAPVSLQVWWVLLVIEHGMWSQAQRIKLLQVFGKTGIKIKAIPFY